VITVIWHNSPELYGIESIRYMNRWNGISAGVWMIVLGSCFGCMQHLVAEQYDRVGTEQSIAAFQFLLTVGFLFVIGLSLLWWFITSVGWPQIARLRSLFERNSKICAAAFSFLAFLSTSFLGVIGEYSINATNGHVYPLRCPFILPAVFVCLMYIAPPIHMREVIFPGKRWVRLAPAAVAALVAAVLFVIDFR